MSHQDIMLNPCIRLKKDRTSSGWRCPHEDAPASWSHAADPLLLGFTRSHGRGPTCPSWSLDGPRTAVGETPGDVGLSPQNNTSLVWSGHSLSLAMGHQVVRKLGSWGRHREPQPSQGPTRHSSVPEDDFLELFQRTKTEDTAPDTPYPGARF